MLHLFLMIIKDVTLEYFSKQEVNCSMQITKHVSLIYFLCVCYFEGKTLE